jgi:hypothetical protein
MPQPKHFRTASRFWSLPGLLLAMALSGTFFSQASAQTDNPGPGSVANLNNTPLGRSHTPQQVLNGTASVLGPLAQSTTLHLVLGLTPPKMAEEEQFLQDMQDPKSPNFHKYLTADEWNARFAPSAEDEQAVVDWAQNNGLTVTGRFKDRLIVNVDGTSENVEKALAVKMNNYQLAGVTEFSNDRDPVIPSQLAGILHSISGLNSIQRLHTSRGGSADARNGVYAAGAVAQKAAHADGNAEGLKQAMAAAEAKAGTSRTLKSLTPAGSSGPAVTGGYLDPSDIYSSYGYSFGALQELGHCCNPGNSSTGSPPATSIAIATSGALAGSDIVGFQARYNYLAYYYNIINVDGNYTCNNSPNLDDACVETTLDTEWSIATSNSFGAYQKTSHVYVYEAVNSQLGTFTDMFHAMLNDGHARVMSTSWGCGEFDCYDSGTMDTDHGIFNSMLGQGWSLLADSDDSGATADCNGALRVEYPASDPDVTAVGGTSLALYTDGTFDSETGWQGGTTSGSCKNNDGGSGGGCSAKFAAPGYQTNQFCGSGSRSVPDISLNAGYGQNVYYDGGWHGYGGTSIATPQTAGLIAQANSYLQFLGKGTSGWVDYQIYYLATHPNYAQHYPFYDMTSGCDNNDITAAYGLGYYCAGTGYDAVTGWGSFNALQLSWGINTYALGDFVGPTITFTGPAGFSQTKTNWYNTNQTVSWTIADNGDGSLGPTGVSGFSQAWDVAIKDARSEATHGTGDSFYSGPEYPNATSGSVQLASAGQGCHYIAVDAWDNSGFTSGNNYFYYICYDTIAPVTKAILSGTLKSGAYTGPVKVTLSASDSGSGVKSTVYQIDGGSSTAYTGPFTVTSNGAHVVLFHSTDVAGNVETSESVNFTIGTGTTVTLTSSKNPAPKGSSVTFTAKVSGKSSGDVQFLDGTKVLATVKLSSGKAEYKTSKLSLGTHSITAYYESGKITSVPVSEVIENTSSTKLASSENPAKKGSSVSFTAKVSSSAGTPTGNVEFKDGSKVIGTVALSSGEAVFKTSSLSVGTHKITAAYQGDTAHYESTSSTVKEVIKN